MKIADLQKQPDTVQRRLTDAKEGITDALLNLTWQRVSGTGVDGEVVFGAKPSMKFVSGFLLPRFESSGEDETSDIHLSTHGLDFQISSTASEKITIVPRFAIYIRALPSWAELYTEANGIYPRPNLKKSVELAVTTETRARIQMARDEDKLKKESERRNLRTLKQEIYRTLLAVHGVRVAPNEILSENPDRTPQGQDSQLSSAENATASDDSANADSPERLEANRGSYIFDTDASAQSVDVPEKWQRIDIPLEPCVIETSSNEDAQNAADFWSKALPETIADAVSQWLATPFGADWGYRPAKILPSNFRAQADWDLFLVNIRKTPVALSDILPDLTDVRLYVEIAADLRDAARKNVRILLENNATDAPSRQSDRYEHALHQVSIAVSLPSRIHRPLKLDRVEPSYRFRNFLSYAAIGVNCGVSSVTGSDRDTLSLHTTWMPRYIQPRIVPTAVPGLLTNFAELGQSRFDPASLHSLITAYQTWIQEQRATLDPAEGTDDADSADRERRRFHDDLMKYEQEVERVNLGVRLLETSAAQFQNNPSSREAIPYRAWLLLNRTFESAGKAKGIESWRLFQLAFILAHIPTLASRMPEFANSDWFNLEFDEETATLLYFPTGGGKSEAFLGLLIFNLFLDRLRGKKLGVTALLRYPLRLLTLQQAQRLLVILIQAEYIRRHEHLDGQPFEIGFWVGNGNTPNRADDDKLDPVPDAVLGQYSSDASATTEYDEVNKSFNKVANCPSCGWMTGLRRLKYRTAKEIAIVCFNPDCQWNKETTSQPLPFLIVDSDIYRHAPSVILGVIDKLALIGQHPSTINRVMGMFGLAKWVEQGTPRIVSPKREELRSGALQSGCEEVCPSFSRGVELFVDPFPSLIIQDEAHLLEESLGTFAGLFETLLEELFNRTSKLLGARVARQPFAQDKPRLPKVIAATATVSVPQQQFGALYQRRHAHFPYPGTSIYESFYSRPAEATQTARRGIGGNSPMKPELASPWMRLYVSLMTNGRTHTVTTVNVLSAYHLAITELWTDLQSGTKREAAIKRLIENVGPSTLAQFQQEAIREVADHSTDLLATLLDLMRISLTYVTNKKGGDQVIDAFRDEVVKMHTAYARPLLQLQTELISGGVDVAEIQQIMRAAQGSQQPGDDFPNLDATLRSIVATSAISHGVDVDKFNAMFFAGMPTDIAEFIQASSRVGRSHVGFCLLVPTPHARRDRYIVETHDIFHRFLERMIAPPAITRWAAAAHDRILASMFQAWLCGWVEQYLFVSAKDTDKDRTLTFQTVNDVNRLLTQNDYPRAVNDFMDFAVSAIGVHGRGFSKIGSSQRPDFYESRMRNQAKQLIDEFRRLYTTTRLSDYWQMPGFARPPMTSLRDIDEAARFVLSREYGPKSKTDDEKKVLRAVLRIVRNQNGRVAELDDDEG
jgi:hypothetical protein